MEPLDVSASDVEAAISVVREVALKTPTISFRDDFGEVFLKLENLQRLGSFKIRGTWNRLSRLTAAERRRGVATISSGNHGLAVAWATKRLGLPCLVRVPEDANPRKVEAIMAHGATVQPMSRSDLVRVHEQELWRSWPQTFIHPFAHPATIAGQGTIGYELADDLPDVRTVLVPVGGGGLASGIALTLRAIVPRVKVFGVQSEGAASLPEALRTGRAHRIEDPQTIADGIRIGIILPPMAELLTRHLDGALLVSDDEIRRAMRRLAMEAKIIAEPAGAAAFAAWVRYRPQLERPVAALVSGGNVDPRFLARELEDAGSRP